MLTKGQIDQFYQDVNSLGLKFPVAGISEATGENKGNVSRILSKKMEPGEAFINKFYESFKIVPPPLLPVYDGRTDPNNGSGKTGRTDQLLDMMMQLLKTQNKILERQEVELISNLKEVLGGVTSIALDQQADRQVILSSLSRLENLPEKKLLRDADKIKDEKIRSLGKQGKKAAKSR